MRIEALPAARKSKEVGTVVHKKDLTRLAPTKLPPVDFVVAPGLKSVEKTRDTAVRARLAEKTLPTEAALGHATYGLTKAAERMIDPQTGQLQPGETEPVTEKRFILDVAKVLGRTKNEQIADYTIAGNINDTNEAGRQVEKIQETRRQLHLLFSPKNI